MKMQIKKYRPVVEITGLTYTGDDAAVQEFTYDTMQVDRIGDECRLSKHGWNIYSIIKVGDVIMQGITGGFFLVEAKDVDTTYVEM